MTNIARTIPRDDLIQEGRQLLKSSADAKFIYRVTVVCMILGGLTAEQASNCCKERKATIASWVRTVQEKGFEGLRLKKRHGRPTRLSEEQMRAIELLVQDDPAKYGYRSWGGPALADYISKNFNFTLGVRQCQRLSHKVKNPSLYIGSRKNAKTVPPKKS